MGTMDSQSSNGRGLSGGNPYLLQVILRTALYSYLLTEPWQHENGLVYHEIELVSMDGLQ
jgi:hypothetical protein